MEAKTAMSKPFRYTEEQFRNAYQKSISQEQMQKLLKCSRMTLHKYFKRFGLKPLRIKTSGSSYKIPKTNPVVLARQYRGITTLQNLAEENNTTVPMIRYWLQMLITRPKRFYLTKHFPPPRKIAHIKIINFLLTHNKENPKDLVEILCLPSTTINEYWRYAFGLELKDYDSTKTSAPTDCEEQERNAQHINKMKREAGL